MENFFKQGKLGKNMKSLRYFNLSKDINFKQEEISYDSKFNKK